MLPTRYRAFTLQTAVSQEREENRPAFYNESEENRRAEEYRKHVAERAAEGCTETLRCNPNGRAGRTAEKPASG